MDSWGRDMVFLSFDKMFLGHAMAIVGQQRATVTLGGFRRTLIGSREQTRNLFATTNRYCQSA